MESKESSRFIFLLSMLFSRGFSINICTDIVVRSSSGYITTPNFPNTYPANISCTLTIQRPFGERINFKFIYMSLETRGNGSCSDSLKISGKTTKTFCGNDKMTFVPGGSVVSVSFLSDSKVGYNGFNITFTSFSESCSFDGGLQTSVCPWSNVNLEDDFNWSINSGSVPTSDTGPSHDITGSTSGKYLYTEASPQLIGDKAWLVGNNLTSSFTCFSFVYHMYGAEMGTLNIYLEYKVKKSLLWSLSGNQGNQWWYGQVTANFTSFPSRLIIEGVRGSSFTSDIAIDNLALTPGYCETVHTHVRFNEIDFKGCDFEKGFGTVDCPWNNARRSENFDWAIISGNVKRAIYLPYLDSKGSSKGKYMYLKSSNGEKARLVSQYFKGSTKCLLFYYYISSAYNSGTSFYVYQETVNGAKRQLFVISGINGQYQWRQTRILISNSSIIQKIIIEGITGSSYADTIAVDDLRFIDCEASSTTPQYYSLDTTTRILQQTTQKPLSTTRKPSSTIRNPFITIRLSSLATRSPSPTTQNLLHTTMTSSPISKNSRQTTQMPWSTTLKTLQLSQGCNFLSTFWTRNCPWGNVLSDENSYDDYHWRVNLTSTRGGYAYVKWPSETTKKKAWFVSEYFSNSSECFKFSYRIHGTHRQKVLQVYQQALGRVKILRWSQSKSKTSVWHDAEVTMPKLEHNLLYRLIIEGVFEAYSNGEINVYKFSFTSGACNDSSKSSSNENAGVIIASVAIALLIVMNGIFIIWYIRHKNKQKTSSTTSSDSYQNPAYSDGEQKKTTVLPPPPNFKSESKSPPVDSNAPFAMAKRGVLYFVPDDNQSNVIPSNPPHNNTNADQMSFISTSASENPYYIPSLSLDQDVQSQYHY
ncbi:MAM and LDL-receptor class A domain-containing protein 1-like isoform X2 [Xenia sp. Carnegie-2017]|uniref:MAM and LDL-receptor class A domain-containing protein 1-like isoform X2 n=1 Tax=Xenia sp. Carnegie-2017 TaxID=2897299 RepID=UPI001F04D019|nr:MAM and LDL-receptor class A domain-containing protein 1-like isoform X2 [Xenia sp. Carnegie-2017]